MNIGKGFWIACIAGVLGFVLVQTVRATFTDKSQRTPASIRR